jgi:hypothetical protein
MSAQHGDKTTVVDAKDVEPKSIEGIALSDGVHFGFIYIFCLGNNPVVLINSCASLLELGRNISYAGPKSLIGTMWSIYDDDARQFARHFFNHLPGTSISWAFHRARTAVGSQYSKLSYVHFGTLEGYLPIKENVEDEQKACEFMANRLVRAYAEGMDFAMRGWLDNREIKLLPKFFKMAREFIARKSKTDRLSSKLEMLRNSLEVKTLRKSGGPVIEDDLTM